MISEKFLTFRRKTTHADFFMATTLIQGLGSLCHLSWGPLSHTSSPAVNVLHQMLCFLQIKILIEISLSQKPTLRTHLSVYVIEQLRILDSEI